MRDISMDIFRISKDSRRISGDMMFLSMDSRPVKWDRKAIPLTGGYDSEIIKNPPRDKKRIF
jgi:hypothetical protein